MRNYERMQSIEWELLDARIGIYSEMDECDDERYEELDKVVDALCDASDAIQKARCMYGALIDEKGDGEDEE